ncbi:MAG: Nucleoid-associated protein [Hyphomicrobiaceae bacterium hypho_1]
MHDFMGMMKQVQNMQAKMQQIQQDLADLKVTGEAGAGLVTVTLNGKGEMCSIKIDSTLMNPSEVEIVEDLIVAATRDAKVKADQITQDKMKGVTGGLPLPPGIKMW